MDGSDGPFEPPVAEETNPVLAPVILSYQIQNKPIRKYWVILIYVVRYNWTIKWRIVYIPLN